MNSDSLKILWGSSDASQHGIFLPRVHNAKIEEETIQPLAKTGVQYIDIASRKPPRFLEIQTQNTKFPYLVSVLFCFVYFNRHTANPSQKLRTHTSGAQPRWPWSFWRDGLVVEMSLGSFRYLFFLAGIFFVIVQWLRWVCKTKERKKEWQLEGTMPWALRSWVVWETWLLGPVSPRMHDSPQIFWTVFSCWIGYYRSTTVRDIFLGPTWLFGCAPPAY